jgi:hypothetical protein
MFCGGRMVAVEGAWQLSGVSPSAGSASVELPERVRDFAMSHTQGYGVIGEVCVALLTLASGREVPPSAPDTPIDCRSGEGETMALIDAAIVALRLASRGDLTSGVVRAALDDLNADREIAKLLRMSPPSAPDTKPDDPAPTISNAQNYVMHRAFLNAVRAWPDRWAWQPAYVSRMFEHVIGAYLGASSPPGDGGPQPDDTARLDWLESNGREAPVDEDAAQISVDYLRGFPSVPGREASGFYFRRWGAVPLDDEGQPDYSRRLYTSERFDTLREAIDAARASRPSPPSAPEENR